MRRSYWITDARPACVIRAVGGCVEPSVAGTSAPDDVVTSFSTIECGKMRCVSLRFARRYTQFAKLDRQSRIGKRFKPHFDVATDRRHPPMPRPREFVAARSPARHAAGRGQIHHEAAQGRSRGSGMAGCDGSLDPGRDVGRAVCADRNVTGAEPRQAKSGRRRAGRFFVSSGQRLSGFSRSPFP
jgi:hypothetical protein